MDSETLSQIFSEIGEEYDFLHVDAAFKPFDEIKVKWMRMGQTASFSVTDYLQDAPEEVIRDIANRIMMRIRTDDCSPYSDTTNKYLTSIDFVQRNQPIYLSRKSGISESTKGEHRDIQDSYERLLSKGLVDEIECLQLRWSSTVTESEHGQSSMLMRTVLVPTFLDTDEISDEAFDFNLYRLLMNVCIDFSIDPFERKKIVEEKVGSYPGRNELENIIADRFLRKIGGEC